MSPIPGPVPIQSTTELADLEDRVDFDREAKGERRRANGEAGVAPTITEHRDHKVGCAVDDLGMIREIGGAIDEPAQLYALNHASQIAATGVLDDRSASGGQVPSPD